MGIGYNDSVIVYNRYYNRTTEEEYYIGTLFEGVRIELTQGANIQNSGIENADACIVKIPNNELLPKRYVSPVEWCNLTQDEQIETFTLDKDDEDIFIIAKKQELGIDRELPIGLITRETYAEGLLQYLSQNYGYVYKLHTVDVYNLIPRFQIGGR